MTPWSRICVSHADCILLVGPEDASPQVPCACSHISHCPMGLGIAAACMHLLFRAALCSGKSVRTLLHISPSTPSPWK